MILFLILPPDRPTAAAVGGVPWGPLLYPEGAHGAPNKKNIKKYLLLGDMLELGKHSKNLHESIAPIINRTKIDKIFVKGRNVVSIFNKLLKSKKGKILANNSQIIELIKSDLDNNDYLMVKASNATGFNRIIKNLRGSN